jgi:hypothetical protein
MTQTAAETTVKNTEKQPPVKLTREERLAKKIAMVGERNSRVARIDSSPGGTLFNIMRQFDQAYAKLKGQMGEFGGPSHETGLAYMDRVQEITLQFSQLTEELFKAVKWKYTTPRELLDYQAEQKKKKKETDQK